MPRGAHAVGVLPDDPGGLVTGGSNGMLRVLSRAHGARFAAVGLAMTALHLAVFRLASPWSVPEIANVVAFLTATQVNFALSYVWTWSSRRPVGEETVGYVLRRAVLFNGSAALGFSVNAAVFSAAHRLAGMPPMHSALVATVASAAASFLLSSRLVFAVPPALVPAEVAGGQDLGGPLTPLAPRPTEQWERA